MKFPFPQEITRLDKYEEYSELLDGNHFDAFSIMASEDFKTRYSRLRYVVANFFSLVSTVSADLLFGEKITLYTGDTNQGWTDLLMHNNKMSTKLYESAIKNSALGDDVFEIYIEENEIKIRNIDPSKYFITEDGHEKAWITEKMESGVLVYYLIRQIHNPGTIETKIYQAHKSGSSYDVGATVSVDTYNTMYGTDYVDMFDTNIDEVLLIHIKNYTKRADIRSYGDSDYMGNESLQFALNNRLTKVDNILDKHSDPILAVPDGVLDENGSVRKEALGMIEIGDDGEVPQYIVWNANIESAFQEIDKLLEMLFMSTEISPDVLGMGKTGGAAESGRALRLRLIRTIAKRNRKRIYYEQGIQNIHTVCQKLSIENGFTVSGEKYTGEVLPPTVIWSDGIVNDEVENADIQIKRYQAGLQTRKDAIILLDGLNEELAESKSTEIESKAGDFKAITNLE